MTLSLTLPGITFEGNGATATFSYPFEIPTAADAVVTFTDISGAQTAVSQTQFTIAGLGNAAGGTITYPLVGSPIASGTFLTVQRILPIVQTTAVSYDGPAFASLESELDYLTMVAQQLNYALTRTIQLNAADINPLPMLPPAAQRANQALFFDANGNPTVGLGLGTVPVSAALQPFLASATTQDAVDLLNYQSPLPGSLVRSLVAKINDTVSILDFIGTGSDYGPAITSAFTVANQVLFPAGSYSVNTNATIPNGKSAVVADGATFTVANGKTLTVNGLFDAPCNSQIFFGTGLVVGMRDVYPEWWGASLNNASFDSQPALQAAHTAIQGSLNSDGGRPTIHLGPGTYYVANTFTVAPTANCQLVVHGEGIVNGGSRIQTLTGFPAAPVLFVQGSSDPAQQVSDWVLSGFAITNGGGSPSVGLKIGNDNNTTQRLVGFQASLIEDVLVDDQNGTRGFPIGLQFCHVRLVAVRRTAVWSRVGQTGSAADVRACINITQAGWFTGDMSFHDVQYVGSANANVTGLSINSSGLFAVVSGDVQNRLAGLRFNGLIGYFCDRTVSITANSGSYVSDIWFNPGCQFDASPLHGFYMQSDGTGSLIGNVTLNGAFLNGAVFDQVNILSSNGGATQDTWVINNWLSFAPNRCVVAGILSGTGNNYGLHICGNEIYSNSNPTGGAIALLAGVQSCRCNGNICTRSDGQTMAFLVQIGATGVNNIIVTENIGAACQTIAVVQDLSGAITKVVANNV